MGIKEPLNHILGTGSLAKYTYYQQYIVNSDERLACPLIPQSREVPSSLCLSQHLAHVTLHGVCIPTGLSH